MLFFFLALSPTPVLYPHDDAKLRNLRTINILFSAHKLAQERCRQFRYIQHFDDDNNNSACIFLFWIYSCCFSCCIFSFSIYLTLIMRFFFAFCSFSTKHMSTFFHSSFLLPLLARYHNITSHDPAQYANSSSSMLLLLLLLSELPTLDIYYVAPWIAFKN